MFTICYKLIGCFITRNRYLEGEQRCGDRLPCWMWRLKVMYVCHHLQLGRMSASIFLLLLHIWQQWPNKQKGLHAGDDEVSQNQKQTPPPTLRLQKPYKIARWEELCSTWLSSTAPLSAYSWMTGKCKNYETVTLIWAQTARKREDACCITFTTGASQVRRKERSDLLRHTMMSHDGNIPHGSYTSFCCPKSLALKRFGGRTEGSDMGIYLETTTTTTKDLQALEGECCKVSLKGQGQKHRRNWPFPRLLRSPGVR